MSQTPEDYQRDLRHRPGTEASADAHPQKVSQAEFDRQAPPKRDPQAGVTGAEFPWLWLLLIATTTITILLALTLVAIVWKSRTATLRQQAAVQEVEVVSRDESVEPERPVETAVLIPVVRSEQAAADPRPAEPNSGSPPANSAAAADPSRPEPATPSPRVGEPGSTVAADVAARPTPDEADRPAGPTHPVAPGSPSDPEHLAGPEHPADTEHPADAEHAERQTLSTRQTLPPASQRSRRSRHARRRWHRGHPRVGLPRVSQARRSRCPTRETLGSCGRAPLRTPRRRFPGT
jgi:hypothetical protein